MVDRGRVRNTAVSFHRGRVHVHTAGGIEVWPLSNAARPLNAQIRITWSEGNQASPSGDGSAITLVTSKGAKVATYRKSWVSGAVHTLLLTPKKALAPQSEYLVKLPGTGGGRVLGSFTTGTTSDDSPPTWKGIAETRYIDEPARCCSCSSGKPFAVIEIAQDSLAVRDDQTAAMDLVFGVWPAQGPIDSTTLLAIAPAWGRHDQARRVEHLRTEQLHAAGGQASEVPDRTDRSRRQRRDARGDHDRSDQVRAAISVGRANPG